MLIDKRSRSRVARNRKQILAQLPVQVHLSVARGNREPGHGCEVTARRKAPSRGTPTGMGLGGVSDNAGRHPAETRFNNVNT